MRFRLAVRQSAASMAWYVLKPDCDLNSPASFTSLLPRVMM